ncbi:MAG: class I SAM-dependent methyltransferase [bacterium]
MLEMWNSRYDNAEYIYGAEPNIFFKNFIDKEKPGKILLAAEGEGRNAVYAAKKDWECFAFDYSIKAREKALLLAQKANVLINYKVQSFEDLEIIPDFYDVAALLFAHIQHGFRNEVHRKVVQSIKSGGVIILEAFSKKQIDFNSGGPKDINMLYSTDELQEDFQDLDIILINEKNLYLNEGSYHVGEACVIELIARKR